MKTVRRELIEVLEHLPDDSPMETLLAEIAFRASVLRGLEDVRRGDVVSNEEVRSRLNKWLASSGRERLSDNWTLSATTCWRMPRTRLSQRSRGCTRPHRHSLHFRGWGA